MNSSASNHVTNELENLSISSTYEGHDDIIVDDRNSLPITHIGSTIPPLTHYIYNGLCFQSMKNNLILVSNFGKTNSILIKLFPCYFLVTDSTMEVYLMQGPNTGGVHKDPISTASPSMSMITIVSMSGN